MTHRSLIQRIGLAGGVAIVAASGALVTTAAGGASSPGRTPAIGTPAMSRHPTAGHCRVHVIDHHGVGHPAGRRAIEHRAAHNRTDRRPRTGAACRDDGRRHADGRHHHGDGDHHGRHHDD